MAQITADELRAAIRTVPDFPTKGVMFKDLTTVWKDGRLLKACGDELYERFKGAAVDKVLGIEARGFIVGTPLAERFGAGFILARKVGKLPAERSRVEYQLEYRTDGLELHKDAVSKGDKILIADDLVATAGTAQAAARLVEMFGGTVVGFAFVVELTFLHGREKLKGYDVQSLVTYDAET